LPVGGKDGLPDNEDAKFLSGEVRHEPLSCGGPPHTGWSGGRE
jgi:hypothetical protein